MRERKIVVVHVQPWDLLREIDPARHGVDHPRITELLDRPRATTSLMEVANFVEWLDVTVTRLGARRGYDSYVSFHIELEAPAVQSSDKDLAAEIYKECRLALVSGALWNRPRSRARGPVPADGTEAGR
jgi:hypothetical protein